MIFILNPNLISLSFLESWSFNIVSKLGLSGGFGFKASSSLFANLNIRSPFIDLKVHSGLNLIWLALHVPGYGAACT